MLVGRMNDHLSLAGLQGYAVDFNVDQIVTHVSLRDS